MAATRSILISAAIISLVALSGCADQSVALPESPEPSPTSASPAASTPEASPSPTTASPSPSPSPSETAAAALLSPGDDSKQVRELQHRLLQIQWYEGKITTNYDEKTELAVEGFQAKRGVEVTGVVDQETWDLLVDMTRQPTEDEMNNVMVPGPALLKSGDSGDKVKDLQARLKQIGWFNEKVTGNYGSVTVSSVEGFQAKRGIPVTGEVDQRTMDRLTAMTRKPTQDELDNKTSNTTTSSGSMTLDDRCLTGRVICISKAQRKLAWVIDGQIKSVMDVRFGAELTPTRNGVFSVGWKSRDHVSSLYNTSMPYAMFFSGGQAVHYSADFARNGYNGASHGCVNVRNKSAVAALFDQVNVGDKVIVYTG